MAKGKGFDFAKKHGLTMSKSNREKDDLEKKIERVVNEHNHLSQLSGDGYALMRDGSDIYQIIKEFKRCLTDLSYNLSELTLRDIRIKTGYPEEIILDIIKYLESDIIAKETDGNTYYSLNED